MTFLISLVIFNKLGFNASMILTWRGPGLRPFRTLNETVRRRGAGGVDLVEIQREGEAVTVAEFAAYYPPAEPLAQEDLDMHLLQ